jgi:toxin CcdB
MARYDVYAHPDLQLRNKTPYLLDIQNTFLDDLETRVVLPLRDLSYLPYPIRDMNPVFGIKGMKVILDTASIAAFPAKSLSCPVEHWQQHADAITHALDMLFGAY